MGTGNPSRSAGVEGRTLERLLLFEPGPPCRLVRATNSGVSAVVDPVGRVVTRTGLLTRETLRATVRPLEGQTVYARLGDCPGWVAIAIVVLAVAVPVPGRARAAHTVAARERPA